MHGLQNPNGTACGVELAHESGKMFFLGYASGYYAIFDIHNKNGDGGDKGSYPIKIRQSTWFDNALRVQGDMWVQRGSVKYNVGDEISSLNSKVNALRDIATAADNRTRYNGIYSLYAKGNNGSHNVGTSLEAHDRDLKSLKARVDNLGGGGGGVPSNPPWYATKITNIYANRFSDGTWALEVTINGSPYHVRLS